MATQIELYRRQIRWEPLKALAALVAAAAMFMGGVLAVANWRRPMPAGDHGSRRRRAARAAAAQAVAAARTSTGTRPTRYSWPRIVSATGRPRASDCTNRDRAATAT
jgi:hypothetical protein